ncbi:proton-conducting transporter membrane subunit [Accumulibacter sp.]|uniref:complex I subunit 5 family protein n=1 Tax=Accumulibacter sp. TaxID=2053492 RepID=UPI0025F2F321|nr:proton-conducting transporter membrane subunit [Accumulibacter sp.]MCM8611609.1 Na+/H+ antiporter subunit D [Accumulibacter sp.]MCM8635374.1 Na+/H+ antiporter subunit D [Accumulibacter sp.]MCM8638979.1 Na+/H+ antiporter subunit D [Accumulibacter sp.]
MLVLTPLLVPLATALVCLLLPPAWQQRASLAGALLLPACGLALAGEVVSNGPLTVVAGGWPLPFGIEFAADRLSAALVLVAALMLNVVLLWQAGGSADAAPAAPTLQPLLQGLVAGAGAAFVTADLFNLYVWFELTLICALGLLALRGGLRQLDATLKYFVLNVFGTLLLLAAVALLYAATGQLNFRALGAATAALPAGIALPLLTLLSLAFLIKAAAFPFFAWLPASYHTLPAPLLALFSALLAKIGLYALVRTLGAVFQPAPDLLFAVLGWIAVVSMLSGALGAAYHWDLRRILAFHSISQIGYILLAIALASPAGNAAAILFMLHHSLVKAALILTAALIFHACGHYDLRRVGGLYAGRPGLSLVFLLLALSLIGIPPSSGFWSKFLVVRQTLLQGEYLWAAFALAAGAVTLYSMLKIWLEAFWKPHPDESWRAPANDRLLPAHAALGGLLLLILSFGLLPESWIAYVMAAADSLRGGS